MIREQVTVQDYERIAKENEYYLWYFVRKGGNGPQTIYSYFEPETINKVHSLKILLDKIDIPYFESYVEDSVDFLINVGIPFNDLRIKKSKEFKTAILAFKKRRKMVSNFDGYCVCVEGIVDMIYFLNPEFILNANLD